MTDPITQLVEDAKREARRPAPFVVSEEMRRDFERLTCTCTAEKLRELGWPPHAITHVPTCPLSTDTP